MNTPCPDCNFYQWRILNAYLNRDCADLRYWRAKQAAHQAECIVINGDWYKLLWNNAVVSEPGEGAG